MNQFKRAKVVLAYTDEAKSEYYQIWRSAIGGLHIGTNVKTLKSNSRIRFNQLYIITDEDLLPNEYGLDIRTNTIIQNGDKNNNMTLSDWQYVKRIIATDNSDLYVKPDKPNMSSYMSFSLGNQVPKLPTTFIHKYINSVNNKEDIINVLVDYIHTRTNNPDYPNKSNKEFIEHCYLKVHKKDNTITIRKLKNNWNREELIKELHAYREFVWKNGASLGDLNKYIEQTL